MTKGLKILRIKMGRVLRLREAIVPTDHTESADGSSWWILLVGLLVVTLAAGEEASKPAGLFLSVDQEAVAPASGTERDSAHLPRPTSGLASDLNLVTLRQRLVAINFEHFTPPVEVARAASEGPSASGVLRLNLFDDVSFTGLVERVAPTFSGGYSLSGRLAGVEMGTMTLVVNGSVVAGTVRTPEGVYRIRPTDGGLHVVSQIDRSRLPPLGVPIPARRTESADPSARVPDRPPIPRRDN